ncbi:MAG: type pilus assembly protein PilC [Candidatus Sumerlaeota bacterium]|nr:type pilus assembly protein PilC [Candidatus Sumerlaeota bacterium]
MPQFIYKAKDRKGEPIEGVLDAEGRAAVVSRLQQMGYYPISIEQGARKGGKVVAAGGGNSAATQFAKFLPKFGGEAPARGGNAGKKAGADSPFGFMTRRRVSSSDLASFNRQMADLLGAGVPLVKSLTILGKQTANDTLRDVILSINADVQDGATFADALAKHPRLFSKLYVAMVRAGEAGGMLDEVLMRLADFSEQEEQLKGKVKAALAYPVVMICAGSVAVFIMFTVVVPKIVGTFKQLNQTLPTPTKLLISSSEFAASYWYIIIGAVVGLWLLVWKFISTPEGRTMWHRQQLRLPLLGDLVRKREVARFSRTLGSLLKNGVSILSALGITRDVLNNTVAKREVDRIIEEITQGAGIAVPLKNSEIFPPVTVNMMSVGEETGQLDMVLLRISNSFEMEVERKIRTLTSLIEPLIIVAMAVVVGFIVIAMLMPIFSLDPTGGV